MPNIHRLFDDAEIALGIWLIASPWLLGYGQPFGTAAGSASVIGLMVLLFSLDDYFFGNEADEWIDAVLGVALMASPFMLGYSDNAGATWNALLCGFLVTGFAAWALERLHAADIRRALHLGG